MGNIEKKSVDAQLAAIEVMKAEFMRFFNGQIEASPGELKARHERITVALEACGGSMDAYWVAWLFGELEQRANDELRKVVLLAQTTEPDELKEKHFPDLNEQLIDNVKRINEYLEKNGANRQANRGKKDRARSKKEEVIYRAKWLLENPEPEYKGRVESYRPATLGAYITSTWLSRVKRDPSGKQFPVSEAWENKAIPDVPGIESLKKYISDGVKAGELPAFLLLRGAPRKNK